MLIVQRNGKSHKFPDNAKAIHVGMSLIVEVDEEVLFIAPMVTVDCLYHDGSEDA